MDNLTYTIGTYIRDILRTDSTILSLMNITTDTAKNYIFFDTPVDQYSGFINPRMVVLPAPSDSDEIAQTGIYIGQEIFQVSIWIDDKTIDKCSKILDRIVTLFNKTSYVFTSDSVPYNYGTFRCSAKVSFKDPDKTNTKQGNLTITLSIGGNL